MTTTPTHTSGAADLPEARLFTKKPVTIAAIQWTGKNLREVITFTDGPPDTRTTHAGMAWEAYADLVARDGLKIYTLEGKMLASPGDWIIRGVKGEYYPCKDEIFEATYSPAALAAGQATAAQAVVPAGWKLVPEQPTLTMVIKGSDTDTSTSAEDCRRVYRAMLAAAPAQPAAQQGVAYAALPESFLEIPDVQDESGINAYYSREVVLECIDAALASHGQAPAKTGNSVSAQADRVQEDAALWHWLAEYLVGARTDLDDEIVASETVNDLRKLVEAARKQGANHGR